MLSLFGKMSQQMGQYVEKNSERFLATTMGLGTLGTLFYISPKEELPRQPQQSVGPSSVTQSDWFPKR